MTSTELRQLQRRFSPDTLVFWEQVAPAIEALAELTDQHQETSDTLTTLIESTGTRLDELTDELVALRAEVDGKLTFLAGCGDDLKARVERLDIPHRRCSWHLNRPEGRIGCTLDSGHIGVHEYD